MEIMTILAAVAIAVTFILVLFEVVTLSFILFINYYGE